MPKKELPDPSEWKRCIEEGCEEYAVFLKKKCWKHLSQQEKKDYRRLIEDYAPECLSNKNFSEVNLSNAHLICCNFKGSKFREAVLKNSNLAGAQFQEADLIGADLRDAQLAGSVTQDNFRGAFLSWVKLDGALNLTWEQIKIVGEEKARDWAGAKNAYLILKNYFHQQGNYKNESKAYYREKLMAEHEAFWNCFRGHQPNSKPTKGEWKHFFPHLWEKIKEFFKWFGLWFFHAFTGFGERWWRTVLWALGVIGFFGGLYWIIGAATLHNAFQLSVDSAFFNVPYWLQYLYFSVVTFATLGFGDIAPACSGVQVLVIFEVIMGYVFLGLIITIIARRFGR